MEVSEEYVSFCEAQEETDDFLNLNLLHDAYMLGIVADELERSGFSAGYLTSDSGLTVSLSGMEEKEFCFYGLEDGVVSQVLTLPAAPGSVCSVFRQFAFSDDENLYYTIEKDGVVYYRSPFVMTKEEGFNNVVMSSCVVAKVQDIVGAVYANILLNNAENEQELKELSLDSDKYTYAYTLNGAKASEVYLSGSD
jgi:hypothetical protein